MSWKNYLVFIIVILCLSFVFSYNVSSEIEGINVSVSVILTNPNTSCNYNLIEGLCINTNINSFTSESCLACELCNTNPSLLGGATCNATLCNSLSSCYYNNTTRKCDQNLDKCPTCANNIREGSEVCDGTDLNSKTCQTQGYDSGNLACNNNCLDFNYSACVPVVIPNPICGDGNIDLGEICGEPGLSSCSTGFNCDSNCKCVPITAPPICGNNIIEGGEVCDKINLNSKNCESFGLISGVLSCLIDCSDFNKVGCLTPPIIIESPIPSGSNLNKILVLEAEKDVNLSTNIRCDFSTDANLLIKWKDGSTQINNFDCNSQLIKTLYSIPNLPKEGMIEVIASISQPCDVCQKTVFVSISEPTQTTIPDNNLISIILFFVLIISLVFVQNKKLKK